MIWNPFRRKGQGDNISQDKAVDAAPVLDLIEQLLSFQLSVTDTSLRGLFSTLMTNKLAAGYIFGFHDACLQIYRMTDRDNSVGGRIIMASYKSLFGDQAGFALFQFSIHLQTNHDFVVGRQSGGEDFTEFKRSGTPTLGLQRIISLGFDAEMVERGFHNS